MLNAPTGAVSIARRIQRPAAPARGRLLLCRHSHTKLNAAHGREDRIRGWVDVPLDAEGKKEAGEIGRLFEWGSVDLVIASDLSRAAATAQAIAAGTGAKRVDTKDLRPWHLGDYQGKPTKTVIPHLNEYYVKKHPEEAVPGGESFNTFKNRFLLFLAEVVERTEKPQGPVIVLVSHFRNAKTAEAWAAGGSQGTKIHLGTFVKDDLAPGGILEIGRGKAKVLFPGFGAEGQKSAAGS